MPIIKVKAPKAPNLVLAPDGYSKQRDDILNNQLRLYFNQLDTIFAQLLDTDGAYILGFPHVAASDTTDQLATADDTPTVVTWNTLESGNGFTLNAPGSATADYDGTYKITYSLQFVNTDNTAHDATVWLKVNNVDVARSTTNFTIPARKSAGVWSYVCGYSEAVFTINAGDEVELYWATDQRFESGVQDGIYMYADAGQSVPYARPAIPSAIGSITFVSRA